jgi:DNA (cytosine-5)-methyltransferase 1
LERENYAVGHCVLGAHSVGSPHIRQRLYWMAHSDGGIAGDGNLQRGGQQRFEPEDGGTLLGVGDTPSRGCGIGGDATRSGSSGHALGSGGAGCGNRGRMGDSILPRLEGHAGDGSGGHGYLGEVPQSDRPVSPASDALNPWAEFDLIRCRDNKVRRIPSRETQPALFPLAYGIPPGRVGLLRGAGNAIVPQTAAAFVQSFLEVEKEMNLISFSSPDSPSPDKD